MEFKKNTDALDNINFLYNIELRNAPYATFKREKEDKLSRKPSKSSKKKFPQFLTGKT